MSLDQINEYIEGWSQQTKEIAESGDSNPTSREIEMFNLVNNIDRKEIPKK